MSKTDKTVACCTTCQDTGWWYTADGEYLCDCAAGAHAHRLLIDQENAGSALASEMLCRLHARLPVVG